MSGKLYLARNKSVAARLLGDEMMLMSGKDSTLFSLNPVASIIWNAADGVTPLDEIVASRICPEFEIAADQALRDAETFARELAGHGILQVSDEPIARPASTQQEPK
jgi:hypothetical protein